MKLKTVFAFALVSLAVLSMSGCSFGMLDNDFQYSVVQKFSSTYDSSSASDYSSGRGVSSCESSASSAASATVDVQFTFASADDSDGIIITEYIGEGAAVTVPETINGRNVVGIGSHAFDDRAEQVYIPASVAQIAISAFDVGEHIFSIEVDADNPYYSSHDGILYNKDATLLIRCPMGRKKQVTLPDGVTQIGKTAFLCCMELESIILPDGLTSIQNGAFCSCKKLQSIFLPATVTSMAQDAFIGCTALRDVYASKDAVASWPKSWVPTGDCKVHLY